MIASVERDNGILAHTQRDINYTFQQYYRSLYTSKGYLSPDIMEEHIRESGMPSLTSEAPDRLGEPIID